LGDFTVWLKAELPLWLPGLKIIIIKKLKKNNDPLPNL
jgi:hypothetical protein